jgi:acyl carrier protein
MDVFAKVIEIVSEQFGVEKNEITKETSFIDDLGADSLDIVQLMVSFEEKFHLEISEEAAAEIATVGEVVDYIEEHF